MWNRDDVLLVLGISLLLVLSFLGLFGFVGAWGGASHPCADEVETTEACLMRMADPRSGRPFK